MKPRFKLRLVPEDRPLAPLTRAEKLANAIGWLRSRGRYVLDRGSSKPAWGLAHQPQEESALMRKVMEMDRRRK